MGLESCSIYAVFKNPVADTDIKDIIEKAGAKFLVDKSDIDLIDTYRHLYFEIRSYLGLTEIQVLLAPGKSAVKNLSIRFSILSPSTVIDQTFAFLNKLNKLNRIKAFDMDNNSKEINFIVSEFKLNKNKIRKRQIVINNVTGLIIEGGTATTKYIHENNLSY